MGNSTAAFEPHPSDAGKLPASNVTFYGADSWIEGSALKQVSDVSALPGVSKTASFPDLHPGRYGPVGVAIQSDRLHPLLVGSDIGCGMALFELDLPLRKVKVDYAAERLRTLEGRWNGDAVGRLVESSIDPGTAPASLGSIGGGNHFCELQAVEELTEAAALDRTRVHILVHSGSRSYGTEVLARVPEGFGLEMDPATEVAQRYLADHDRAVAWAQLNRAIIAERAATALRADVRLVCDVVHNLVRRTEAGWVHYKGAAAPMPGAIAPVAGSRDSLSYVVRTSASLEASLGGISHGAGRKYDRASMHHRGAATKSAVAAMGRNRWGGRIVCEDKDLLLEEAAGAYKDAGKVVADLESHGLVSRVATMRPIVTFKRARIEDSETTRRGDRGQRGRS